MLAELDVVVFLKLNEEPERAAGIVFGALGSPYAASTEPELDAEAYEASGVGLRAVLTPNAGDLLDPEFEDYAYSLEITSHFWCVELDTVDIEGPLSEYFARLLAFQLNVETATELLLETTEEAEIYEIRAYRRNPQYRFDQSPTTPKVFVIETRQLEEPFDDDEDEDLEADEFEEDEYEDEPEDEDGG